MSGCLIYWFFASGELQPWAKLKVEDDDATQMDRNIEATIVEKEKEIDSEKN